MTKLALAALLVSLALPALASPPKVVWDDTGSDITDWGGKPLVIGSATGKPECLESGKLRPLLTAKAAEAFSRYRFARPVVLSDGTILFRASEDVTGNRYFLMLYDPMVGNLSKLSFPGGPDHFDSVFGLDSACIEPASGRISWTDPEGRQQVGIVDKTGGKIRPLVRLSDPSVLCGWDGQGRLYGIRRGSPVPVLLSCGLDGKCESRPISDEVRWVNRFLLTRRGPALQAVPVQGRYQRAFLISRHEDRLSIEPISPAEDGDVLDYDGDRYRIASQGNYRFSEAKNAPEVVYGFVRSGKAVYAIVAGLDLPRTLARLDSKSGQWIPVVSERRPELKETMSARPVAFGKSCSGYRFGPENSRKFLVVWHSPSSNESRRYYAFSDYWIHRGYSIVAPNYPGTPGWGYDSEKHPSKDAQKNCVSEVLNYVRSSRPEQVLSWSFSGGAAMQALALSSGEAGTISAIIDQVGNDGSVLFEKARDKKIPYFAIRGSTDLGRPARDRADFEYEGNHFVFTPAQQASVFEAVEAFLQKTNLSR